MSFRQEPQLLFRGHLLVCQAPSWLRVLPQIHSSYWIQNSSYSRLTLCGPSMATDSSDFLGLGKVS